MKKYTVDIELVIELNYLDNEEPHNLSISS